MNRSATAASAQCSNRSSSRELLKRATRPCLRLAIVWHAPCSFLDGKTHGEQEPTATTAMACALAKPGIPSMKTSAALPLVLIISAPFLGASCATTSAGAPPPADREVKMTCMQPTMTPLQETKEMQLKGGVQIILAMEPFQCVSMIRTETRPGSPSFAEQLLGRKTHPGQRYVEVTKTPYFSVKPERLKLTLKISNQLSRVFRGAGTVVQFTVAGKTWSNKVEDYAEFTNVIVPPRGEQQIEIYGPPTSAMPRQGNIGLFLYDVVTKTDAAGNITEKQNYEWYYNYVLQTKEETGAEHKVEGWEGDLPS